MNRYTFDIPRRNLNVPTRGSQSYKKRLKYLSHKTRQYSYSILPRRFYHTGTSSILLDSL